MWPSLVALQGKRTRGILREMSIPKKTGTKREERQNRTLTEITNELFSVVVDQATLLDCFLNGSKVGVGQNHISCQLGNICATSHSYTDVGLLKRRSVIYTITSL